MPKDRTDRRDDLTVADWIAVYITLHGDRKIPFGEIMQKQNIRSMSKMYQLARLVSQLNEKITYKKAEFEYRDGGRQTNE